MNYAAFVLSTGRCGTQWLAKHLAAAYGDRLSVAHEPLHDFYEPRRLLRTEDPADTSNADMILAHVPGDRGRLATTSYLECGHPCWAAIPYLARCFAGRLRVIHLVRHPVPTACSWVTHGWYCPPLLPGIYPEKTPLTPFDDGVLFPEYRQRWPALGPFEKCLYFWLEVHARGLQFQQRLPVPWLRITYEDLFEGDGLKRLCDFLELPARPELSAARAERVDVHRYVTNLWWDAALLERHPHVCALARELGYDPVGIEELRLKQRYCLGQGEVGLGEPGDEKNLARRGLS